MAKILIVEDTPEEREKAQKVVESAGYQAIVVWEVEAAVDAMAEGVDGVLTDLFFNPYGYNMRWQHTRAYQTDPPPCGLEMVIAAMHLNIPVVICTDGNKHGGHHEQALSWLYDAFIAVSSEKLQEAKRDQLNLPEPSFKPGTKDYKPFFPFGWEERKDWQKALGILQERMAR